MKISQSDLKQLEKEGTVVKRAMGKQPKKAAPKPKPKPRKPPVSSKPPAAPVVDAQMHASMRSSLAATERLMEQNAKILEHNNEVIQEFAESVKRLEPREPSAYTFDLERDEDKLLKRVYARPGIVES